jgi:urease accessory protein
VTGADVLAEAAATPGWQARLEIGLEARGPRTRMTHRRQYGPLAVQRPFYPEGDVCHLYLLHPPGGVVGGDRIEVAVDAGPLAQAVLTTPGATKCYRSSGTVARVGQTLRVGAGATLEWLPQESILFPGAALRQETRIELAVDARFAGWEVLCLGRPANAEAFSRGMADVSLGVWRAGVPLLAERLRIDDGQGLSGPAGLRGHPVVATLLVTPATAEDVGELRELAAGCISPFGVTLIDGLLVARLLAEDTLVAKRLLQSAWQLLRPRFAGRRACVPRIWAT